MVLWIASRRWAWVKYPIYDHDEKDDNLDNDPSEPRNTTVTLAQELAACRESLVVFEAADPLPLPSPPVSTVHGPHGPDGKSNRLKARIGEVFCKKLAMARAAAQERDLENAGLRDRRKRADLWSGSTDIPRPTNRKQECVSSRRTASEPTRRPERSGPGFQFTGSFAPISFLPDRHISLGQYIARNPYEPWRREEEEGGGPLGNRHMAC
ncbi:hypothetical protein VTN02DRAFT_4266 [Thermoascus thermophilus]